MHLLHLNLLTLTIFRKSLNFIFVHLVSHWLLLMSKRFNHVLVFVIILLFVVSYVVSLLLTELFHSLLLLTQHVSFFVVLLFFFQNHVFQKLFLILSEFHSVSVAVSSTNVSRWLHSSLKFIIMKIDRSLI